MDSEEIIAECQRLNDEVTIRQTEIAMLSRQRGELVMALNQQHGFTMRQIARRLAVSPVRVTQLIAAARKSETSLSEDGN